MEVMVVRPSAGWGYIRYSGQGGPLLSRGQLGSALNNNMKNLLAWSSTLGRLACKIHSELGWGRRGGQTLALMGVGREERTVNK